MAKPGRGERILLPREELDVPGLTLTVFVPDEWHAGGVYVTVTGRVRHVSVPEKTLVMADGTDIDLEDVVAMAGSRVGSKADN